MGVCSIFLNTRIPFILTVLKFKLILIGLFLLFSRKQKQNRKHKATDLCFSIFNLRGEKMTLPVKEQITHWYQQYLMLKGNEEGGWGGRQCIWAFKFWKLYETQNYIPKKWAFMWENKAKDIFRHSRIQSLKSTKLPS